MLKEREEKRLITYYLIFGWNDKNNLDFDDKTCYLIQTLVR